jgi:hypothetical protein
MTANFKVILFLFCLLLSASSCKKSDVSTPSEALIKKIYAVGVESPGNGPVQAKLWSNGDDVNLSELSAPASATSVFVSGTDVYATGSVSNKAGYWKNGLFIGLGLNPVFFSNGRSIFVSNNDVYVAGYEFYDDWHTRAIIWKNGKAIILGDSLSNSNASSVFVSGSDVYAVGSKEKKAMLWVNGMPNSLTDGTNVATAFSVFKSGTDVYVAGVEYTGTPDAQTGAINSVGKIWKNGVATNLTDGSTQAFVNSVFVSGSDVYVAGNETTASKNTQAKLWKNGKATNLTDGTKNGQASSVYVSGSDVYVGGNEAVVLNGAPLAKYWKNGTVVNLSSRYTFVSSIFVQ